MQLPLFCSIVVHNQKICRRNCRRYWIIDSNFFSSRNLRDFEDESQYNTNVKSNLFYISLSLTYKTAWRSWGLNTTFGTLPKWLERDFESRFSSGWNNSTESEDKRVNPFLANEPFFTPWKHQKTTGDNYWSFLEV